MESAGSSEMLLNIYHTIRCHISNGNNINSQRRKNLKPHKQKLIFGYNAVSLVYGISIDGTCFHCASVLQGGLTNCELKLVI
jgi:hypothetical protein